MTKPPQPLEPTTPSGALEQARDRRALSVAALSTAAWGFNVVILRHLSGLLDVTLINVLRLGFAGLCFGVAAWALSRRPRPLRGMLLPLFLVGFLGTSVYQWVWVSGLKLTPAGVAALVGSVTPVYTALLGLLWRDFPTRRQWWGIALSCLGVALIATKSLDPSSGVRLEGLGLVVLGNLIWALYTVLSRPLLRTMDPLSFNSVAIPLGALPYLLFGLPLLSSLPDAPLGPVLLALVSAFFANFLAFWGWSGGVKVLGPTRTAVLLNLTPVVALAVSYFALGEPITLLTVLAAAITLCGVTLASLR